jgi:hypothetical protein
MYHLLIEWVFIVISGFVQYRARVRIWFCQADIEQVVEHTGLFTTLHMSPIIHVSEILMLNAIYHYYEVSGEINPLYLLQLILRLLLRFYLVSIAN